MLKPRIIPSLLICDGALVKTIGFTHPTYIGDPLNAVRIFNEKEVDELTIFDISATVSGKGPDYKLLEDLAGECRMPLCYGGGVRSADQVSRIVSLGIEKVALGAAAVECPGLIAEAACRVGSQSVVVVLDVKRRTLSEHEVFLRRGAFATGKTPVELAIMAQKQGAGEIVVNSIDFDGKMSGYDIDLARNLRKAISIPLTILGGAGSLADIRNLIREFGIIGAAAGTIFVLKGQYRAVLITYPSREAKEKLIKGSGDTPGEKQQPIKEPLGLALPEGSPRLVGDNFNRSKKVWVVSVMPPPPGGVAIHADRLCRRLAEEGFDVTVFDPTRRRVPPIPGAFKHVHGRGFHFAWTLISGWLLKRPDLIHIHVSTMRRVLTAFPLTLLMSATTKILITIHGGSFVQKVAGSTNVERFALRFTFARAGHVIAVSEALKRTLVQHVRIPPDRVSVIPAYLPAAPTPGVSMRATDKTVVLASGFPTRIYAWDCLLDAVQGVDGIDELAFAVYGKADVRYFDKVLQMAAGVKNVKFTLHRDLSATAFQEELAKCTIFVRPTVVDGDAVSIREALVLGKTVIASDAVTRPKECITYAVGSSSKLRERLRQVLASNRREEPLEQVDYGNEIAGLYRKLIC